jgi:hypothetical protein
VIEESRTYKRVSYFFLVSTISISCGGGVNVIVDMVLSVFE